MKLRARSVMARRGPGVANGFRERHPAPLLADGGRYTWSATRRKPWTVRVENRRRNREARISRRRNR